MGLAHTIKKTSTVLMMATERKRTTMTDIRFYHLTTSPLERALPQLMERAAGAGFRVVIKAGSSEAVEKLNSLLWTFAPDSFLPHGSAADGSAEAQPIWLTAEDENPNAATLLAVTDGSSPVLDGYTRVLDLFDGDDETTVQAARKRWKAYKEAGHDLQYWQQTESGSWTQKA